MKHVQPAFGVKLEPPYFDGNKWVSPFNFLPEVRNQMNLPSKVHIHDVTLRDGEQTPRVSFTPEEKIFIAQELDKLGVSSIEPGIPATPEDIEVIRALAGMKLQAKVVPLVRIREEDVRAAIEAKADGMLLEFGINPYLVKHVYNTTPEALIQQIAEYSRWGKDAGMYVEFMGWDVFRIPDLDYIYRFFDGILEKGHLDRITVSDTFGMAHPLAMFFFIRKLKDWFPQVPIGLHIHNDYGLATANALSAVAAGVDEIHSSVNGLGERAGNVATEEVAVALELLLGVPTGIDLKRIKRVSQIVAEVSKVCPSTNKPIVGDRLFEVESGIVVHILRTLSRSELGENALFPYPPEAVGQSRPKIIAGKGSGHNSVEYFLEERGLSATPEQIREIVMRIKKTAMVVKNGLPQSVLESIIEEVLGVQSGR
jgi:2-isopropylmalate synthase